MEEFVNMIVGDSTTLDVYVIVRIVVVNMALELFAVGCAMLGRMRGR